MTNKICEKCKPDKPETHENLVYDTGCKVPYSFVEQCMIKNNGNVSSCKEEWKSFKECFTKANNDKFK